MDYREVIKVIAGSVAVYAIVVACGADGSSSGTAETSDEQRAASGRSALAVNDGSKPSTSPSRESGSSVDSAARGEGVNDGAAGMLHALLEPVPDALAQEQCSCSVTEPIELQGPVEIQQPVRMVTADSDPAQALQGRRKLTGGYVYKLEDGPLFVTNAQGSYVYTSDGVRNGNIELHVVPGTECTAASLATRTFEYYVGFVDENTPRGTPPSTDVHFLVPAGSVFCASTANDRDVAVLRWSGFRPYGT